MKNSIYDLYIKNDIMAACETYFNKYLKKEGVPHEGLTEEERELVSRQIDFILEMITRISAKHGDNEQAAADDIADKLVSLCVIAKMNEARLCRLLNEAADKLKDN